VSPLAVTALRWSISAAYGLLAFVLTGDGADSGDMRWLVVVGALALVVIIAAGWAWGAREDDDDADMLR